MQMHKFKKIRCEKIDELQIEAVLYQHETTGAELLHLPCDDVNKSFTVHFATRPSDHTGVPHIVEHAVLAGSDKYPLKEPFLTLMQGSMSTFLNAMTYADSTLYPIASANHKDYFNLMDVYLDGVFHPITKSDKGVFLQEGWQFVEAEDGTASYNGVVYSEMRGAMSGAGAKQYDLCCRALFDNCYYYSSGGNPDYITDLSYEDFLAFHEKHYHPSNSRFVLYGDLDIDKTLAKIDEVITPFGKGERLGPEPLTKILTERQYESHPFYTEEKEGLFGLTWVLPPFADAHERFAISILLDALFDLESSSFRQELIKSGFCSDLNAYLESSWSTPTIFSEFHGVPEEYQDPKKAEEIVMKALRSALEEPMEELLLAAWNALAFSLRESDMGHAPKGVIYAVQVTRPWASGADPFDELRFEEALEKAREEIKDASILKRAQQSLLDNAHSVAIMMKPDPSYKERQNKAELEKVTAAWAALSEAEKEKVREENLALKKRQSEGDSPEVLAAFPQVGLADVDPDTRLRDASVEELEGAVDLIHYDIFTKGISNIEFNFSLAGLKPEDLTDLAILNECLGKLDTKKRSYSELTNRILSGTGGISSSLRIQENGQDLCVRVKVLPEQLSEGLELVAEILTETDFSKEKRIRDLMNMSRLQLQEEILDSGNVFARMQVGAQVSPVAAYQDMTQGVHYYNQLKALLADKAQEIGARLDALLKRIVNRSQVRVGLVGDSNDKAALLSALPEFLAKLPSFEMENGQLPDVVKAGRYAFITASDVHFVAMGGLLPEQFPFSGQLRVLNTILDTDYLWNSVRVKGGAYGCFLSTRRDGQFVLSSFRDPRSFETLDVYRELPQFLRESEINAEGLERAKISTVANFDRPLSPAAEGRAAINRVLNKISLEELKRERQQILDCTVEELKAFAEPLADIISENRYCIFGNGESIKAAPEAFDEVSSLL